MDEAPASLSIREAAEVLSVSAHTLRYYERVGLLGVPRAASQHRRYSARELEALRFLLRLRATGMPIAAIRQYVTLAGQGESTTAQRTALLLAHRADVLAQMERLRGDLAAIEHKLRDHYRAAHLLDPGGAPPALAAEARSTPTRT